ncbi:MAG: NAD(P)-dependent oxidoreductase [Nitrospinae bacterium]|nr:NAD(P)-dependent oxidoreductase [Nitrospinota bacterium]
MKAIVFGGTGFIGSHVVEQLSSTGHEVTVAARDMSNTKFLENLGVNIVRIDFSNSAVIEKIIEGHEVVYNCTAAAKLHTKISMDAEVEIKLTRTLIETSSSKGASRFIQLSTIVIYDFRTNEPIDESYISHPEYPIQSLGLEKEKIIEEVGTKTGIETIVLRPASAIGTRDHSSFFARLFAAHANDQYPIVGNGDAKISLVDTRDIGRAMVWLGTYQKPKHDNGVYLLKGFDTTWNQLKKELDNTTGKISKTIVLPEDLADEQLIKFKLTPFAFKTFTVNRLWNDNKIRKLGFYTKYSLTDAVEAAVRDLIGRSQKRR